MATGGSGPITAYPAGQQLGSLVAPITPAPATNAVDVPVHFARSGVIVGAPRLVLTYSGPWRPGPGRPGSSPSSSTRQPGVVLGNQVTPIDVTLDGATHTTTVPLEIVAYTAAPVLGRRTAAGGHHRLLRTAPARGSVTFSAVHLTLPVASTLTPVVPSTTPSTVAG